MGTITLSAIGYVHDTTEMERANKFHHREHARLYKTTQGLLRFILSLYLGCDFWAITYEKNAYSKPSIKTPHDSGLTFNLSHSNNLAAVIVARSDVGIDIERIDPSIPTDDIARSFFAPTEFSALSMLSRHEKLNAFYRLWTRKEALLKATGEGMNGLSRDLDLFTESVIFRQNRTWHVMDLSLAEGYAGAMAINGDMDSIKYMDWDYYRPAGSSLF